VTVPRFGFMAAASSTLISYALLAILTGAASQRFYPVPWDYPRVLGAIGLGMALSAAGLLGPDALAWRILCFLAFPVVVLATGILSRVDALRLFAWASSLPGRLSGSSERAP
jgi:hypothetical protein